MQASRRASQKRRERNSDRKRNISEYQKQIKFDYQKFKKNRNDNTESTEFGI